MILVYRRFWNSRENREGVGCVWCSAKVKNKGIIYVGAWNHAVDGRGDMPKSPNTF
jgi:hypothetical protein